MFGQNHKVRIHTLEQQMNFLMREHNDNESALTSKVALLQDSVKAQAAKIEELQHALNGSNKRINQLYEIVDQRLSYLGCAVGQHEQEIATLVDFKNALSTTGIVMKVADVAADQSARASFIA